MSSNEKKFRLANIRAFLDQGFNSRELRRIVYDTPELRSVYDNLNEQLSKSEVIDRLIEYADRQLLLDVVLDSAKVYNPARYAKHQPYYETKEDNSNSSVEFFGSDVVGLASEKADNYLNAIGTDALAVDGCISIYHNISGLIDGYIRCEFLDEKLSLPPDLNFVVNSLVTHKKNGAKSRLVNYSPPLSDAQDYLHLTFSPTDYYSFLAINTRLDEKVLSNNMSIRDKYWRNSFDLPTSPLPNMFYVHILLISSDNKVIILRRSKFVEEYKGAWSATFEEQFRPKEAGGEYDSDVFDTAVRGVREEIGLNVERKDVTFLSLTFEYPNFNLGLAGVVKVKETAQEIWRAWQIGYTDREISRFTAIHLDVDTILPLIRNQVFEPKGIDSDNSEAAPWHPTARFRLLFGLLHHFGLRNISL
jgi:hypothetical protein